MDPRSKLLWLISGKIEFKPKPTRKKKKIVHTDQRKNPPREHCNSKYLYTKHKLNREMLELK